MNFMKTYFDQIQVTLLLTGGVFFFFSLLAHLQKRNTLSLFFLSLFAICIFSFSALLDPFLNLWDERFHALVAKNLMMHPLLPTLYDEQVVDMAYDRWDRFHIWLHKQPLFLWQIALCFKLFGISEFVLRLPNIILGTVLVIITYRTGQLLINHRVGYLAGILTVSSIYLIELIAGRQSLDHNDFTFLVYVSLSIWSLIEYYYSNNKKWIYLIGLFSGMAILCKWLVGLLVYLGWMVVRVSEKKISIAYNWDILKSLLVTLLVAAPWQLYILFRFPEEARLAYEFISQHFLIPLEGHEGSMWYHFQEFNSIYGFGALLIIIPAIIIFIKQVKDKKLSASFLIMLTAVYIFFSFAATKMPSFPVVVAMIVFIVFASLLDYMISLIDRFITSVTIYNWVIAIGITTLLFIRFDIESLQATHTQWKADNHYTRMLTHNRLLYSTLNLPSNSVLFNVKGRHYIEAMFYMGMPAYNFVPSYEQYHKIKKMGRTIVVFKQGSDDFPDYLINDSKVMFINREILGYE